MQILGLAKAIALPLIVGMLLCTAQPAAAQFEQQGPKLVGTGYVAGNISGQGFSVAVSADGNTAIVGDPYDNGEIGAAWLFTQSAGVWTQQGPKLVGSGALVNAEQGFSVALSADGNTAFVGGPYDQDNAGNESGAAWVFTRSAGVWTQQGAKIVGTGYVGYPLQGFGVSLSADGNTALVGGYNDNSSLGAAWVFTRSGGVWTQQGSKLAANGSSIRCFGYSVSLSADGNTALFGATQDNGGTGGAWVFTRSAGVWTQQGSQLQGTGYVNSPGQPGQQGFSVSLSADGNTAIIGGPYDNDYVGAAWVFTRSAGVWSQQGTKLVGTGAVGANPQHGYSVALSGNGNTAIVGAIEDNRSGFGPTGAAWVFTRSADVWTQQESKLVGNDIAPPSGQGSSVALSSDGSTALVGGVFDGTVMTVAGTSVVGATWVYVQPNFNPAATHDFNGDGKSDILWENISGTLAVWLMNGGAVLQAGVLSTVPSSYSVIGQHDFDGDGKVDVLWRDSSGNVSMWFMNGTAVGSAAGVGNLTSNWTLYGTGDLNGDGKGDLLWRDSASGTVAVWFMNGAVVASTAVFGALPNSWTIVGDANGDILWRDSAGDIALWGVQNGQVTSSSGLGTVTSNFVVQGIGDFNGDGNIDILWRDTNSGTLSIWFTNGAQVTSGAAVGTLPNNWSVAQIGDYNGDGMSDILLLDSAGDLAVWLMNGAAVSSSVGIGNVGTTWQVQNLNAN